jgi:hypothetical protein
MALVFIVRWVRGEGNLCTIYQFGVGNTILIKIYSISMSFAEH